MINKCTMNIEQVEIPKEIEKKMRKTFYMMLKFSVIFTLLGFCSELVFTVLIKKDYGTARQPYIMIVMTGCTFLEMCLGWFLSTKFGIFFHGYPSIIALSAMVLKFEGMFTSNFDYSDLAAMYFLMFGLMKI